MHPSLPSLWRPRSGCDSALAVKMFVLPQWQLECHSRPTVLIPTQAFHLVDTSTFELKRFGGPRVPDYAILSHTWEPDEEISYQEIIAAAHDAAHPARRKSGFRKIEKTCELARAEGLGYVWIDTCCIDKSSSAELSEAINSMFQWYQGAELCYAYLEDLQLDGRDRLEDRMPGCRWFTRGWCLQELIAPRDVLFFDSAWRLVGSKTDPDIRSLISHITNINENVLVDITILSTLPVAQKMSWAANRETTRTEDIAYCLLGIFDINMPMLYGEGKKAFRRLQEEIIRRSNDLSIFAWSTCEPPAQGPSTRFINLFAESPRDFSDCSGLTHVHLAGTRAHTFSLTNNGLLLTGTKFFLDVNNGCYVLPIGSKSGHGQCLALKKITSKMFFRVVYSDLENYGSTRSYSDEMDVFIPPKIGLVDMEFRYSSNLDYVQLRSPMIDLSQLQCTIMDIFPKENWDAPRLAFLKEYARTLACGYVKFDGSDFEFRMDRSVARIYYGDRSCPDFYLVWRIEYAMIMGEDSRDGVRPLIRTKLYTEDEFATDWESLSRNQGHEIFVFRSFHEFESLQGLVQRLALSSGNATVTSGCVGLPEETTDERFYIDLGYETGLS